MAAPGLWSSWLRGSLRVLGGLDAYGVAWVGMAGWACPTARRHHGTGRRTNEGRSCTSCRTGRSTNSLTLLPSTPLLFFTLSIQTVKKSARYRWFGKGGKKAAPAATKGKEPRFYPADDVPVPRRSGRTTQKVRCAASSVDWDRPLTRARPGRLDSAVRVIG